MVIPQPVICVRVEEPSEGESDEEADTQEEDGTATLEDDCQRTCGCLDRCECGTDWTPEDGDRDVVFFNTIQRKI